MNLPNKLVLDVSDDDIKTGNPLNPWECPFAKATNRALPGTFASVAGTIRVREGKLADYKTYLPPAIAVYQLTKAATNFMRRFDSGRSVKPRRFVLRRLY